MEAPEAMWVASIVVMRGTDKFNAAELGSFAGKLGSFWFTLVAE